MVRIPVPEIPPRPVAEAELPAGFAELVSALQYSFAKLQGGYFQASARLINAYAILEMLPAARENAYRLSAESIETLARGATLAALTCCDSPAGRLHERSLDELNLTMRVIAERRAKTNSSYFIDMVTYAAWEPLERIYALRSELGDFRNPVVENILFKTVGENPFNVNRDEPADEVLSNYRQQLQRLASRNPHTPSFSTQTIDTMFAQISQWITYGRWRDKDNQEKRRETNRRRQEERLIAKGGYAL